MGLETKFWKYDVVCASKLWGAIPRKMKSGSQKLVYPFEQTWQQPSRLDRVHMFGASCFVPKQRKLHKLDSVAKGFHFEVQAELKRFVCSSTLMDMRD